MSWTTEANVVDGARRSREVKRALKLRCVLAHDNLAFLIL